MQKAKHGIIPGISPIIFHLSVYSNCWGGLHCIFFALRILLQLILVSRDCVTVAGSDADQDINHLPCLERAETKGEITSRFIQWASALNSPYLSRRKRTVASDQ